MCLPAGASLSAALATRAKGDVNEMDDTPAVVLDQPHWHPWWRAYCTMGNRAAVLITRSGMWYTCHGTPELPALWYDYAGDDEAAARAVYDSLCAEMRESA